jgi:hypothetical protein
VFILEFGKRTLVVKVCQGDIILTPKPSVKNLFLYVEILTFSALTLKLATVTIIFACKDNAIGDPLVTVCL